MELYEKRENLRNQIKGFWKSGITFTDKEMTVSKELNKVHNEIVEIELTDDDKPNMRESFSVCGWSERHGYFRSKRFVSDNLKDAKNEFELAKKESDWGIPTLIVKHTHLRSESPAMVDFEGDVTDFSFSDHQELVDKHMCGNRHYRWKELLNYLGGNYTY